MTCFSAGSDQWYGTIPSSATPSRTSGSDVESQVVGGSEKSTDEKSKRFRMNPRMISDAIIGLSDGLTVPFALSAGLSAFNDSQIVVLGGLAELIAGAISMGLGGFIGAKSEAQACLKAFCDGKRLTLLLGNRTKLLSTAQKKSCTKNPGKLRHGLEQFSETIDWARRISARQLRASSLPSTICSTSSCDFTIKSASLTSTGLLFRRSQSREDTSSEDSSPFYHTSSFDMVVS